MVVHSYKLSRRLAAAAAFASALIARAASASAVVAITGAPSFGPVGEKGGDRPRDESLSGGSGGDSTGRRFRVTGPAALKRSLQAPPDVDFASGCGLCPVQGSTLRVGGVPSSHGGGWSFPAPEEDHKTWTCQKWDAHVRSRHEDGSAACLDARDGLMRKCCDGLPPQYECAQDVQEMLGIFPTSASDNDGRGREERRRYRKSIAPIGDGEAVNMHVVEDVDYVEIFDHGVGGGAIEVAGTLTMSWTDERLAWNASEVGCTSLRVLESDIWMPDRLVLFDGEGEGEHLKSRPKVMANGRVSWTREGSLIARCKTMEADAAKKCDITYTELREGYDLQITTEMRGQWALNGVLNEEYTLNQDLSGLLLESSGDSSDADSLGGQIYFDPVDTKCTICGHGSLLQENVIVSYFPELYKEEFGGNDFVGSSCAKANAMLATISVTSPTCSKGRAELEEMCCDDKASSFECESNIHDTMVEELNTISPPDPSPREGDRGFSSKDKVDVTVLLDVLHIFDIDIKSSTMTLLAAVEMNWYDARLSWDPFIGGCHRITYRASNDAELTEIWVPEIELINQVEGIQTLSEAHASVRYDGRVKWRRTGVLEASCAMTGLKHFPFDETGCYLEFGAARDPLYHRIKYVAGEVEFSGRVQNGTSFQEYTMDVDKAAVAYKAEDMSGFSNELITYQFYFTRATKYYVVAFVLLYILLTYLSFGMFFIDYSMGERLGYGSSILFVIVAQDITMSDKTPVTNDMLWIYNLSFGSKIFVLGGLIQSLVILYMFSHGQDGIEMGKSQESSQETSPLVHKSNEVGQTAPADEEPSEDRADLRTDLAGRALNESWTDDGEAKQGENSTETNPCKQVLVTIARCPLFICRHDLITDEADSIEVKKLKTLRRMDWFTSLFFFLTYSVFVLITFLVLD